MCDAAPICKFARRVLPSTPPPRTARQRRATSPAEGQRAPASGTSDIAVFDHPATLQGKVIPDRVITHAGFDNRIGVQVDAQDRLLVGVRALGQVLIFNHTSTLDGPATPDVELSISGADVDPQPSFAATDSEDRLYVADASGNVVFSFDQASQLTSGERPADRTIDSSDLIAPNRLLLFERR